MQCHLIRIAPRSLHPDPAGEQDGAPPVADAVTRHVERIAPRALPLPVDGLATETWQSPDGALRLWSWSNEEVGCAVRADGGHTCVVGSGYAHRPLLDVAADAAAAGGATNEGDAVLDRAGGIWALGLLARDGVQVASSHAGIETWFVAEAADGSRWVGTRPLLVHLAASVSGDVVLDEVGLAGLLNTGHCLDARTPYLGTSKLAGGRWWVARQRRPGAPVEVKTRARPMPERGSEDRVGAALADALIAAAAEIPAAGAITSGLTGGRDSRLVVGALVAAGHDVRATTHGWEGNHDVVVARRVAEVLGIPHQRTDPPSTAKSEDAADVRVDPELLLWRSAVLSDGLIGPFDARGGSGTSHHASRYGLSGSGGEIHRGGHAALSLDPQGRSIGPGRAEGWLRDQHLQPLRSLIRDDVREGYDAEVDAWVADLHRRGADTMADYFMVHRVGQWFTGARLGTTLSATARTPFLDDLAVLATASASVETLHSERPLREAFARIHPDLLEVPFVGSRLAGEGPAPVKHVRSGAAAFAWKTQYGEEVAESLRALMDTCPVLVDDSGRRHLPPGQAWPKATARRAWHAAGAGLLATPRVTDPAWRSAPATKPVLIRRHCLASATAASNGSGGSGAGAPATRPEDLVESGARARVRGIARDAVDRVGLGAPARSIVRGVRRWRRQR